MSGTSLDGVDGVVVDFSVQPLKVLAHASCPFSPDFQSRLLALQSPGLNELHLASLAANEVARLYAGVVHDLLAKTGLARSAIQAIGAHGQTVRHQPQRFDGVGYTTQINSPALLSELCGIDVVADFRSRDLAAGGQGAPLVPAFHAQVFGRSDESVAVLNVGGIANLSLVSALTTNEWGVSSIGPVLGFDCGPGNVLMDDWCQGHLGQAFDAEGAWAASGQVQAGLLSRMLAEPYFSLPPPKSTGRDLFNRAWLEEHLQDFRHLRPVDVQATLLALTAQSIAHDLAAHSAQCKHLIACGGGALNTALMVALQACCPRAKVQSSTAWGLPPLQVEATAFAWLAYCFVNRQIGNLPKVTGAQGGRVLGCLHPA
jgi:anhydro-N-acetylmuramic acid kinase